MVFLNNIFKKFTNIILLDKKKERLKLSNEYLCPNVNMDVMMFLGKLIFGFPFLV
ncbi:hypothetical protein HV819_05195 [Anaerococcus sp. AGMB00486]|uniref:Uncharacterized protein n=1 Tax=Anaerococcus faecalis TaxID=2742993 RepID=A0ABX2NA49_9FIRM|nr:MULTISPECIES: hypothetical protein [Anaerococcus]MDY3006810.1 hypothetical protein [Anaerococcus porci]NVF11382.1 hypothetical protein [Anaerococcus faecalis]